MHRCIAWDRRCLRQKGKLMRLQPGHADAGEEVAQRRIGQDALVKTVHSRADRCFSADALIDRHFIYGFAHIASLRGFRIRPRRWRSNHGLRVDSGRLFNSYGALLVIGFARDRIEGALRNLIRVAFSKVKGKKYLAWRDNFRDP